jgi:glutathione S-transferase
MFNSKDMKIMKLYFSPGACCMSCHIALEETKTPFELVYVGKNADEKIRKEYLKLNPLGAVPTLQLDNGKILTQNIAILGYIADQKPEAGMLAKVGSWERAETMCWLSVVAADLHKSFAPLFAIDKITANVDAQKDIKKWSFANIDKYLSYLESYLQDKTYLVAEKFSIADCYLFTVYQWTKKISFPIDKYSALNKYSDMLSKRPSIMAVHKREEAFQ